MQLLDPKRTVVGYRLSPSQDTASKRWRLCHRIER